MKRFRVLTMAAILALALPGCVIRTHLGLDIHEDGSYDQDVVVAFDSAARRTFQLLAGESIDFTDPEAMDIDLEEEFGLSDHVPYQEGDFIGFRARGSVAAGEESDNSVLITVAGDTVTFKMDEGFVDTEEDFPFEDEDMDELEEAFDIALRVKMPGRVTSHNATSVDPDGTLVWQLSFSTFNAPEAVSEIGGLSGSGWLTWILVAAAVAALVVGWFVFNNRKKTTPVPAPAASPFAAEEE